MDSGYRVVTLQGVVFEKNQCITGGGEQKGGAMKSNFAWWKSEMNKYDIEKMKIQIQDKRI